ncbi:hypothetical protein COO91_00208 [Nostoc flagelliforme CCNUN1]|uniref:Uncharacterized protein n=1 Tax=Nostoc flagelliforme CCNUN1 TaxID=2038116 RepID=A0A2K8SG22_9NOSO|nr:hypothetical protein COO91_00208 [Nostoc flagelliforme CCNUN1]
MEQTTALLERSKIKIQVVTIQQVDKTLVEVLERYGNLLALHGLATLLSLLSSR